MYWGEDCMKEKTVLMIIDDDRDDRFFFCTAVAEMDPDIECWAAISCEDGLGQLGAAEVLPDFIFLDLNMPVTNGRKCLETLKKDERLKNIPVIIYSTSDYQQDIDDTMELGASYYLVKTWDINKLPEEIKNAMEKAVSKTDTIV
jgi:DNA-binding NarL/FixJ family response regulator